MKNYSKPALSFKKQVKLLSIRGLIVSNTLEAERFLKHVNYYRFSAYCLPFEESRHKFKAGVKFEDIKKLYNFDRQFRSLVDEALELIEISIRTLIAYYLAHKYGSFVHESPGYFYEKFDHKNWISKVHEEISRSTETFIEHYKKNYQAFPKIPIWMAVEVISFGGLSILYKNLLHEDQKNIAQELGVHHSIIINMASYFYIYP